MRSHVCLPGDVVLSVGPEATVAIGGGLRPLVGGPRQQVFMVAEVCAPVGKAPLAGGLSRYTLDSPAARRYAYAVGDPVVAIVARKTSSLSYGLYTGGPALASLDALAFDGATKASRPRLLEGDVVFAHVRATAAASGEAELSCVAAEAGLPPKDWTSGESAFGPLVGGRVVALPLSYARSLLTPCPAGDPSQWAAAAVPASYLLAMLGARVPFDVCVGANGLVWVRGQSSDVDPAAGVRRTVAVCACLTEAQYDATAEEMEARVAALVGE